MVIPNPAEFAKSARYPWVKRCRRKRLPKNRVLLGFRGWAMT